MSHSRKNLKAQALSEEVSISPEEKIAQVTELRGSNVCEIRYPDGSKTLGQIPTRFRKLIWIKRGNYVLVREPETWNHEERKVRAMVEHVLFPDQIKTLKKDRLWPPEFDQIVEEAPQSVVHYEMGSDDEDNDLFVNPNRQILDEESEEEDSEDDSDDDSEEDSQ
eukprot:TRINITY_DN1465_c0_g1_i1.p1 TRINITY_DN1465_c0_g1~~TRINITY_DN1465_c0_g1_i1.p1  ORF type:complete len:190 (+),score=32.91 TRINITY_DN1465_c0_g1_i1:77-571(+)